MLIPVWKEMAKTSWKVDIGSTLISNKELQITHFSTETLAFSQSHKLREVVSSMPIPILAVDTNISTYSIGRERVSG